MIVIRLCQLLCAWVLIFSLLTPASFAAPPSTATSAPSDRRTAVTVQQMVEPAFHVQPVVHQLEGARGETIHFSFMVESLGRDVSLEVKPVALRQEESGVVLHDELAEAPLGIRLSTLGTVLVAANQPFEIKGEITIPRNKAKLHSFGILVRDAGQRSNFDSGNLPGEDQKRTQAAIRFVTQYVLRCDVRVTNATGEGAGLVTVPSIEFAAVDGLPFARVHVENPTDSVQEFRISARLGDRPGSDAKAFPLVQPSRANLPEEQRDLIRIWPKSRVRLEAPVPGPLLSGRYMVQLKMTAQHRSIALPNVAIDVAGDEFPAQETQVAELGGGILVSPSQLELGQTRGSRRVISVKVLNHSDRDHEIHFSARSLLGSELPGLQISPKSVSLAPGKSQRVTIMLRTQTERTTPECGFVKVTTSPEETPAIATELPLSVLYGSRTPSQVVLGEMYLEREQQRQKFVLPVTNSGQGFAPVNAELLIADENGRTLRVAAGYGRWLKPQETKNLDFVLPIPLAAGVYQLQWNVRLHPGDDQLSGSTNIRVSANLDE